MKLIEKYTLDHYASIPQIKQELNIIGLHLILDEIEKYRTQFRHYFIYKNQTFFIDITPSLTEKMNQIIFIESIKELHPLIQVFILRNDPSECLLCIQKYGMDEELFHSFDLIYSFEEDITYSFHEWLSHLDSSSIIKMIHLKHSIKTLSKRQQQFYNQHIDQYFDLHDYMNQMKLCYESARIELNKLAEQGIYKQYKVGKRHVFKGGL